MSGVSKLIGNSWVDEIEVVHTPSGISDDFKDSLKSLAESIIERNKQTAECKQRVNGDWIDDREQLKKIIEDLSGQIAVLTKDNEEFADGLIEQEETIEKLKAEITKLKGTK